MSESVYVLMVHGGPQPIGVTADKGEAEAWRRSAARDRYWLEFTPEDDTYGFLQKRRERRASVLALLRSPTCSDEYKDALLREHADLNLEENLVSNRT